MRLWCVIATLAFVTSAQLPIVPTVPADDSPLASWDCSLGEDAALVKKQESNAAHANVNGSLGFVLLVLEKKGRTYVQNIIPVHSGFVWR